MALFQKELHWQQRHIVTSTVFLPIVKTVEGLKVGGSRYLGDAQSKYSRVA